MKLKKFLTGLLLLSLTFMPIAHAAQHDMAITVDDANTGATVRAAISSALQALAGLSSGATEPSTTYAYQLWADTTTGLLKIRNAANTAWVTLVTLSDPSATTSVEGIVELATNAESVALTDTARAVTPSNISAILDNIPKNVGIGTAATTNALTINGNAYISPSYSVLAGLFQDSANGSYYLDPANTGTSLYTAGIIHSTSGGFKFPDNSVQTSASKGIVQVVEGTPNATPLSIAAPYIPLDNTIPQSNEGTEIVTATITPTNASNRLRVSISIPFIETNQIWAIAALFRDSGANAIAGSVVSTSNAGANSVPMSFHYEVAAGSTSATTFKLRIGGNTGTLYINRDVSGNNTFGGICAVRITITEIAQ